MHLLDTDIQTARAIIIDPNPTSRSVLSSQLRDLGVQHVRQLSRVQDAREVLENAPHDIVLCEMSFHNADMSGQDLLDELRREQLLPYHTVFMMVTGEATASQVVEAAEATVDGYLVKPLSAQVLARKLGETRQRKRQLKPIFETLQTGQVARAAALAEVRFRARQTYWSLCGQVAAELWLRADQPQQALRVYQSVLAERPLPWARAGVARAHLACGEMAEARQLLDALVQDAPDYADGQDLLGRLAVEQGDFDVAHDAFRRASTLSPGCLLRMQHWGTLAFYRQVPAEAMQQLERTVALGRRSRLFDLLCLPLLGMLKFDAKDARGFAYLIHQIDAALNEQPDSVRLLRMKRVLQGLSAIQARRLDATLAISRALAEEVSAPDFDLEAATLVLGLWSRMPRGEQPLDEFDRLLRQIGARFCISRPAVEWLLASAQNSPLAEDLLHRAWAEVGEQVQAAEARAQAGSPLAAVQQLVAAADVHGNARLLDAAATLAREHAAHMPNAEAVMRHVQAVQEKRCSPITHLLGVRRSARSPGSVVLRT